MEMEGIRSMYDVIIVGAGPAGSTCARECAQQGLKTLLLDKDTFPRTKPCGGAVSGHALSLLDFPLPDDIIEKECFGARVHYSGRSIEANKQYRIAVFVSRDRFDAFLALKSVEGGARFLSGEKVLAVHTKRDGITVVSNKTSYQTRFLIGADGVHSRVANVIRHPLGKDEMILGLVSSIPANDELIDRRQNKTVDMHFGIAPQGYGWLFPHRGYHSLGIMGLASMMKEPKKVMSDFAHSLGMELSAVQGHFIPCGGRKRIIASGSILLVGDAAGFADPFHGEGIAYALLSGKLAAQAIIESIEGNSGPSSAVVRYRRESERLIRKNLLVAHRIATLLDRYPSLFLRIFFDHPDTLERYLDVVGGRTDYRHFQQWLLPRVPWYLLSNCIFRSS
jgi:geranylgeranyl reductase family protein